MTWPRSEYYGCRAMLRTYKRDPNLENYTDYFNGFLQNILHPKPYTLNRKPYTSNLYPKP